MWAMAGSAPGSGYLACDGAVSRRWWFAAAMGLVTATFSTIAVVLGAGRFGRDVDLSWMEVGMVLLREAGISATPTAGEVAAGLAVHVVADFFWALVFFGVLGPWTRRLGPLGLLAGALPWALATAAVEYYAVLPWLAMQTPYWVAAMVHTASALAYPLAFWLAGSLLGDRRWSGFGRGHAVVLGLSGLPEVLHVAHRDDLAAADEVASRAGLRPQGPPRPRHVQGRICQAMPSDTVAAHDCRRGKRVNQDIMLGWVAATSTLSAARRGSANRRWRGGYCRTTGFPSCQPTCSGPCCAGSFPSLTPSTKIRSTLGGLPSSCTRISSRRPRCASRRRSAS